MSRETENQAHQDKLLDELLKDCQTPEEILGKNGLLKQLTKRLVERVLEGELDAHLGYERHQQREESISNYRNGKGKKTVQSQTGPLELEVPRDREGSFEPQLVKKRQRRLSGFDEQVIALYARGLSTRDIQEHLQELYDTDVSPALISNVTNGVLEEVRHWQARPLSSVYPILYFDALMAKSRHDGAVKNKAVYLALGITMEGEKELLGLWINDTEGAKFWLSVFKDLQNRGVEDCFIACVDGLKGLPEAIEAVFPKTQVQLCIVHKVRNSLNYVPWKERRAVAADLRAVYTAATLEQAEQALEEFSQRWDAHYPAISPSWRADWQRLSVFFDYPAEIRKIIYTTNAIESLNFTLRHVLKRGKLFANDDAIRKVLYLALRKITKKWSQPIRNWRKALNQFVIMFGDRVPLNS